MSYIEKLNSAIENVQTELSNQQAELEKIEAELSDQKLNPYGITNIDFSKRMELMEDIKKIEGAIMGLNLAKDAYEESVAEEA
jgi:hypothetical protein